MMTVARVCLSGHSALPLSTPEPEGKPEWTSQTAHLVHCVLLSLLYLPFLKKIIAPSKTFVSKWKLRVVNEA